MPNPEAIYEQHARDCSEQDFWRQVRRTVNGKPIGEDQIALIVDAVRSMLELAEDDVLLDLCCGNGALSHHFFEECSGGLGVDYSETLIAVARKYFPVGPSLHYKAAEALQYLREEPEPKQFTKALIYGSISYFQRDNAELLLAGLRRRFSNVSTFVIGNIADLDRIDDFFNPGEYRAGIEERPDLSIGVWWSRDALQAMAARTGWSAGFHQMPEPFYARHYRFDAVLRPA